MNILPNWVDVITDPASLTNVVSSSVVICIPTHVWSVRLVSDLMTCQRPGSGRLIEMETSWSVASSAPEIISILRPTWATALIGISRARTRPDTSRPGTSIDDMVFSSNHSDKATQNGTPTTLSCTRMPPQTRTPNRSGQSLVG